jgi:acetylornithine deacetylase/succinyl-diaminopimelate desuccinylase-like protein
MTEPAGSSRRSTVILGLLFLSVALPVAARGPAIEAAREYRETHGVAIVDDFAELLAIPNVPAEPQGLTRTAEAIVERFAARGARMELLRHAQAPPVVFGTLSAEGATRTLGIYVHYDGQPVDVSRWSHPPFEPTLVTGSLDRGGTARPWPRDGERIDPEWRIYARSAGDDKAPLAALLGAIDALDAAGIMRTTNLVFLFEGEEEAGSTHLADYLGEHAGRMKDVDLWLICDGPVHQSRRGQLVFGVRGYTGLEIVVYGAERYLHSGHYGNWAPNPALELSRLLASMKDERGQVLVEGFYDSVDPMTSREREALARVPATDVELRRELGLATTEAGNAPLVERLMLPSLNIRGLESARVGTTARNIIPTRAEASIDIRLVRGNDPQAMLDLVERHIERQGFHIVRDDPDRATRLAHPRIARVVRRDGYPAVRTAMDLPLVQPVIRAAREAAGDDLVLMPSLGGSLPLYLFRDLLDRPMVIVPIANHDNNQHAPDENLRIANLWYGMDLFAAVLTMP